MKKITIIATLLFSSLIFGQTVNDLDIKNGFRHFKLGSHQSQIKDIKKQSNQFFQNPNVVIYEYIGNDIDNIFNVKVESIELSFFKNKLFHIQVKFGSFEDTKDFEVYEFNNILSVLERTYGSVWYTPKNEDNVITNGAIWDGKKVRLELYRVDFSKSKTNPQDYGYILGYIAVFDKKISDEMYSSNF